MFNRIFANVGFAIRDMSVNRTRTVLSLLGISIGIFCITMVNTLIDSLNKNLSDSLSTLGSDVIYVNRFSWIPEPGKEYPFYKYLARPGSSFSEFKALKSEIKKADQLAICYTGVAKNTGFSGVNAENFQIQGVTYDFSYLQNLNFVKGRFFSQSEAISDAPIAVVGYNVYEALSEKKEMLNQYLNIDNHALKCIGVMKKYGQSFTGFDFDNSIIMPYLTSNKMYNFEGHCENTFTDPMLMVKLKNVKNMDEVEAEITSVLRKLRHLSPKVENNFSFNRISQIQKMVDAIFAAANLGGFFIGGFSLLIGIFGITNIMFVSVKERTPMIGLKKSIGAKKSDILIEFLSESILLCIVAGVIGILLIILLSYLISSNFDFKISVSSNNIIRGFLISVIAGVLAGFIPAYRAAQMNPVDAIRSN